MHPCLITSDTDTRVTMALPNLTALFLLAPDRLGAKKAPPEGRR